MTEFKFGPGTVKVQLRPLRQRLWNSYCVYRAMGFNPLKAFRFAWFVSRIK